MSSKRLYYVLIGVIILLFAALIGGTYGVNSLLTTRANSLTTLKAKSLALDEQRISLAKSKQDVKKYAGLKKITQAVVPEDKNQAEAVREIVNIAAANGISLASITFPASTLGSAPTGKVAPAPAAAPGPVTKTPKAFSQLLAVKNIPGVYQLTITVQGDANQPVRYEKFVSFLSDLEHNRRTAQVSTITIQPDTNDRNFLSFTLNLNEYIKP